VALVSDAFAARDVRVDFTLNTTDANGDPTETPPVITVDSWRSANFGASAIDPSIAGDMADPDGDGYTNLDEFTSGSNPLDSTSVPGAAAPQPSKIVGPRSIRPGVYIHLRPKHSRRPSQ
jgi:hypothetical protein